MLRIFYNDWQLLVQTLIGAILAYPAMVFLLRVSGKRTLSKMNAFDLVVTVALGSVLAAILLNSNTSLAQGVLAFGLLVGLQYVVNKFSVHWGWFQHTVKGDPALLAYQGQIFEHACRHVRVPRSEVLCSIRKAGLASIKQVHAVVLETDGTLSVIEQTSCDQSDCLADVRRPESQ
ncbi:MAG: DUF421 domain-containing protein [Phycisphaerae bacterium]